MAATTAAFTLPTSVTKPLVSANARFTWSATVSTGVATNVISASGSRPTEAIRPIATARSHRALSWSSPATCQPRSVSARAMEPPISPRPTTFARRRLDTTI
jgi:hypothetical protein